MFNKSEKNVASWKAVRHFFLAALNLPASWWNPVVIQLSTCTQFQLLCLPPSLQLSHSVYTTDQPQTNVWKEPCWFPEQWQSLHSQQHLKGQHFLLHHFYTHNYKHIITYYYECITTYYYILITSLLCHWYVIIMSLLQMRNHVIMIPFLHIMQWVCSQFYITITCCYIMITKETIVTHQYTFQSPKLADVHNSISR